MIFILIIPFSICIPVSIIYIGQQALPIFCIKVSLFPIAPTEETCFALSLRTSFILSYEKQFMDIVPVDKLLQIGAPNTQLESFSRKENYYTFIGIPDGSMQF